MAPLVYYCISYKQLKYSLIVLMMILDMIALWKIFVKANRAGWKALIPFYNIYIEGEISINNGMILLITYIALEIILMRRGGHTFKEVTGCIYIIAVNIVELWVNIKLARKFNHSILFGICMSIFSPVFQLILAFDDSKYFQEEAK